MRALATANRDTLEQGLVSLATGYATWLAAQRTEATTPPAYLQDVGTDALAEARRVLAQLEEGIRYLLAHDDAIECLRFMNAVMADQRNTH